MDISTPFAFALSLCAVVGCRSTAPPAETTTPQEVALPDDGKVCASRQTCAWSHGRVQRTPVLVLEEMGGWRASEYPQTGTPTFTLYEDGLVLFVEGAGAGARVRQAQLSPAEVEALTRDAHDKLDELPDRIATSEATDQPMVMIRLHTRTVSVWGIDREGKPTSPPGTPRVGTTGTVPAAFAELYASLRSFRTDGAQPWSPDEIAIRLHRHDAGESEAAAWPSAVPLPPEGATEPPPAGKPAHPRPLQYRVDGALEDEVVDALEGLGEPPIVRWSGKSWILRVSRVVPG
jgi:hypothetical protein